MLSARVAACQRGVKEGIMGACGSCGSNRKLSHESGLLACLGAGSCPSQINSLHAFSECPFESRMRLCWRRSRTRLYGRNDQVLVRLVKLGDTTSSGVAGSVEFASPHRISLGAALAFIQIGHPKTRAHRPVPGVPRTIDRYQKLSAPGGAVIACEGAGGVAEQDLIFGIPSQRRLVDLTVAIDVKLFRPRNGTGRRGHFHIIPDTTGLGRARRRRRLRFLLHRLGINFDPGCPLSLGKDDDCSEQQPHDQCPALANIVLHACFSLLWIVEPSSNRTGTVRLVSILAAHISDSVMQESIWDGIYPPHRSGPMCSRRFCTGARAFSG